jgi:hypothetical protein
LMLRGSRNFISRDAYEAFLRQMFEQCNAGRRARLAEELPLLRALPVRRLEACKRDKVRVDTSSTIRVEGNVYSVNSRLIGEWVEARLYAERVEIWYAQKQVEQLPRLRGRGKHQIAYRHVIDWLVRKPGAFADYRYRADLFPSSRFRGAYDVLLIQQPERAAKEYLSILQLAARESESGVEAALSRLMNDEPVHLTLAAVIAELRTNDGRSLLEVTVAPVDLALYDALLESKEAEDGNEPECEREGNAAGVPEGTAPASVPCELRGAGSASAAGIVELRAVSAGAGGTGVPGAAEPPRAASATPVAAAVGEELADARPEASADQGGAAGAELAGGLIRGSA